MIEFIFKIRYSSESSQYWGFKNYLFFVKWAEATFFINIFKFTLKKNR